jgi:hypothetical protein
MQKELLLLLLAQVVVVAAEGGRTLIKLGADMRSTLNNMDNVSSTDISQLLSKLSSFFKMAANCMIRWPNIGLQLEADVLPAEYAVIVQKRLCIVGPFESISLDKQKLLSKLCSQIATAQCVPSSATDASEAILLLVELMNLVLDSDHVQDVHNLRMVCKTTHRRAFPVPMHRHIELPIGVIECFLAGEYSAYISYRHIHKAHEIHNNY